MKIWRVTDWDEITEFHPTKKAAMARAMEMVEYGKSCGHWYSVTVKRHTIERKLDAAFLCYALTAASNGERFTDDWGTVFDWHTPDHNQPE